MHIYIYINLIRLQTSELRLSETGMHDTGMGTSRVVHDTGMRASRVEHVTPCDNPATAKRQGCTSNFHGLNPQMGK